MSNLSLYVSVSRDRKIDGNYVFAKDMLSISQGNITKNKIFSLLQNDNFPSICDVFM